MKKILLLLAVIILPLQINAQIFDKLKKKAEKVINKTQDAAQPTESTTSPSRNTKNSDDDEKKHLGKITFSRTRGGAPEKNFVSTDTIYARINFPQKLKEIIVGGNGDELEEVKDVKMLMSLGFDTNDVYGGARHSTASELIIRNDELEQNFLDIDIVPDVNDVRSVFVVNGNLLININSRLGNFGDKVSGGAEYGTTKFNVTFGGNEQFAGSFYITVSNIKEAKALQRRIDAINEQIEIGAKAAMTSLPAEFNKPSGKFADPQLSMAAIRTKLSDPSYTILKLVIENIPGADYEVRKNYSGIPEFKITAKPIWLLYKTNQGKCFFTRYYFRREHEGGGRYGELSVATTTAEQTPIKCENAN